MSQGEEAPKDAALQKVIHFAKAEAPLMHPDAQSDDITSQIPALCPKTS